MNIDEIIRKISFNEINIYSYNLLKGRDIITKRLETGNEEEYVKLKQQLIEKIVGLTSYHLVPDKYFKDLLEALTSICKSIWNVKIKLVSRGIVGMGESFGLVPFEVGLSFHPLYNVPYIPSSTIKGAVRNACRELNDENIVKEMFGTSGFAGIIGFTDAFPVEKGKKKINYILYPDIITPHYPEAGTELEVSPNPIVHLSIAPGTIFRFLIYAREKIDSNFEYILIKSLLYALSKGIGARTSVGYSLFEPVKIVKIEVGENG